MYDDSLPIHPSCLHSKDVQCVLTAWSSLILALLCLSMNICTYTYVLCTHWLIYPSTSMCNWWHSYAQLFSKCWADIMSNAPSISLCSFPSNKSSNQLVACEVWYLPLLVLLRFSSELAFCMTYMYDPHERCNMIIHVGQRLHNSYAYVSGEPRNKATQEFNIKMHTMISAGTPLFLFLPTPVCSIHMSTHSVHTEFKRGIVPSLHCIP